MAFAFSSSSKPKDGPVKVEYGTYARKFHTRPRSLKHYTVSYAYLQLAPIPGRPGRARLTAPAANMTALTTYSTTNYTQTLGFTFTITSHGKNGD